MSLSYWLSTDPVPTYPPLPSFTVRLETDYEMLARINRLPLLDVHARRHSGHRPYVAYLGTQPASYGWVATREASIGELNLAFTLPPGHRYLWDFATLPEFRGQGLYPRLLQGILAIEKQDASSFWIIHAPENLPSGTGIDRAGFEPVGELSFRVDGGVGLQPFDDLIRAQMGSDLLGVPLIEAILSPCWSCGGTSTSHCGAEEADTCWPPVNPAAVSPCTCAIPVKKSEQMKQG